MFLNQFNHLRKYLYNVRCQLVQAS